jgi:hypothetical protein
VPTEPAMIGCLRVRDRTPATYLVPGSSVGACSVCGEPVLYSPSALALIAAGRGRLACVRHLPPGQLVTLTAGQAAEVAAFLRRRRDN